MVKDKRKIRDLTKGFTFNVQGHIETGTQYCHFWDSKPHTVYSLELDAKLTNLLATKDLESSHD